MNDSDDTDSSGLSRRNVLVAGLGAVAAAVLAACGRNGNGNGPPAAPAAQGGATTTLAPAAQGGSTPMTLAPTPECMDDDDVTPSQTEGPYFKASSPERTNLRGNAPGTLLMLTGTVVTTRCVPVSRALVDFWQSDGAGNYDNTGFNFRGHQFTDAQGRYQLETVVPGLYPGRTRHIHVKVQAPNGRVLTTQLYFPGEARNASDGIYREECEIDVRDVAGAREGTFTFVLA